LKTEFELLNYLLGFQGFSLIFEAIQKTDNKKYQRRVSLLDGNNQEVYLSLYLCSAKKKELKAPELTYENIMLKDENGVQDKITFFEYVAKTIDELHEANIYNKKLLDIFRLAKKLKEITPELLFCLQE